MSAIFPAPELCQGPDENLIISIGAIVFPSFVQRNRQVNGLQLSVDGDYAHNYRDKSFLRKATDQFQILLGILRAWNPIAGERKDEIRPGVGPGSVRDGSGNQYISVGTAIIYVMGGSEIETYAHRAKLALERSREVYNALWLHGRRDRNAADFYMIYEYAEKEFSGPKGIKASLGISKNDIKRLKGSANNLAPVDGGRHAKTTGTPEWNLDKQKRFIADFLKQWIEYRGQ